MSTALEADTSVAWIASSVGLEHYFDRVGVTGSSPVQSTLGRTDIRSFGKERLAQ